MFQTYNVTFRILTVILIPFAVAIPSQAHGQCETKLTASDAAASDFFGNRVAVSGDVAIIAARGNDDGGSSSGSAYIVARHQGGANNWGEVKKLNASDAAANDLFGYSVAIHGDTAIVGARLEDDGGSDSGSAYVFGRDQGGTDNWGEVKKLKALDLASFDLFGHAVAIHTDTIIVGAHHNDDDGGDSGSAYIIARHLGGADNWGEVKKLTASDAGSGDEFGFAVAISGDIAIVGAPFNDDAGSSSGAVYVFERNQGGTDNWGEVKKLTASDAAGGDRFGYSVAISGDFAVVGAYFNGHAGFASGAAYVFARNHGGTDNWGEVKTLTASDADVGDFFGFSVGISGDNAIVGAYGNEDAGFDSGSMYVFARNHGGKNNWGEVDKVNASDAAGSDEFGASVAIDGETAIVGAQFNDDNGSGSGSAYVYDTSDEDCNNNSIPDACDISSGTSDDVNANGVPDECESAPCPSDLNGDTQVNVDDLLILIGAWGTAGAADLDTNGIVNVDDLLILIGAWGPCP